MGSNLQGPTQNLLSLNQTQQQSPASHARMEELLPVDLGEQVIGSVHEFEVPAPRNLSNVAAVGKASVQGALGMTVAWPNSALIPSVPGSPMKITFAPVAPGLHSGTLTVVLHWTDGHVETRSVAVTARARALQQAPHDAKTASAIPDMPAPRAASNAPDTVVTTGAQKAQSKMEHASLALATEQREGVSVIEREAAKFKPPTPERTLWQELVELAVAIGTAGVASVVGKYVAGKLSSVFVSSVPGQALVDSGKASIAAAEAQVAPEIAYSAAEIATQQRAVIAAKVSNYAAEGALKTTKWAESEIGPQISGAIGRAFTTAVTVARGPQPIGSPRGEEPQHASTTSKDEEIAFFSDQRSLITAVSHFASDNLTEVVTDIMKDDPQRAPKLIEAIGQGINESLPEAKEKQQAATSQQFMAYMARARLGVETATTEAGPTTVTKLDQQRAHRNIEASALVAGVLEIDVSRDHASGAVSVSGARVNGISHLVADRLRDLPLAGSGVPVRLSLFGGSAIITLDEAGRVRLGGVSISVDGPQTEVQQLREAERIARVVLSKTLSQWGLERIQTNDASQPPPSKKAQP